MAIAHRARITSLVAALAFLAACGNASRNNGGAADSTPTASSIASHGASSRAGWSDPAKLGAFTGIGEALVGVSCPQNDYCVAIQNPHQSGVAYTFDGARWSPATVVSHSDPLLHLSCSSRRFCMATGGTDTYRMINGRWTGPLEVEGVGDGILESIVCFAANFCMATDNHGHVYVYNGDWRQSATLSNPEDPIIALSCSSRAVCVGTSFASTGPGTVYNYSDGSWSGERGVDQVPPSYRNYFDAVSCVPTGFCMAVDPGGYAFEYSMGAWDAGTRVTAANAGGVIGSGLSSVACWSATACLAASNDGGGIYRFDGASDWHLDHIIKMPINAYANSGGQQPSYPDSLACTQSGFCAAVTNTGLAEIRSP